MENRELLGRVVALLEEGQGIAFIVPEDTGYFSIDDELIARVGDLIARTAKLMGELSAVYDAESVTQSAKDETAAAEGDFLKEIGAQISSELAAREIASLAFVARGQLLEIQASLDHALKIREIWAVASHADSGLRRAGRALITLESAMCEYDGLPTPDRRWVGLQDSLEIRQLYGQFRRAILRGGSPWSNETLTDRLKNAATRIAILRDLKIYPFLRIHDRKQIRSLQKRIVAWLNGRGDSTEEAGRRLWQDLVTFARLLVSVNDREELREHDLQAARTIYRILFRSRQPPLEFSEGHLKDLERLLGRDDEIDAIILHPKDHGVHELRRPLERLLRQLSPAASRAPEGFHPTDVV